jgi:nitrate/nitrite transport system ATP-binding protein
MDGYHALRDHILDFLITRSRTLAGKRPEGWDPKVVPEVRPAASQNPLPPRAAA